MTYLWIALGLIVSHGATAWYAYTRGSKVAAQLKTAVGKVVSAVDAQLKP